MAKDDEIFDIGNLDKGIEKISTLITRLNQADAELVNLSKNALSASKALGGISTPGGLGKSQGDNAKTLAELEKLKVKYADLEKRIIKLNEARKVSEKLSLQEKVDARIRLANANAEAKAVSDEADAYQKLAAKLALAQKNAQAIGAQWGSDSKQFKTASDSVKKLDDEIKKIDAGIGKHQRNVGNYAGGWNALGNSVNQITREAPAAAVSMNTFFLAISNNLPAFFDAISGINEQNKQLKANGEKTVSVWKQLGSAIFSFQTLLSVGVTLLTLYGGKLIDLIFNTNELERALKRIEIQQARYNKQLEDANRNIEHNLVLEKNRRKVAGETAKELIGLDKEAAKEKLKNYEITRDANKKLLDDRIKQVSKEKDVSNTGYVYEIGISEKLKNDKIRIEKEYNKAVHDAAYSQDKATRDSSGKLAKQLQDELTSINFKIKTDNALTQDEIFLKRQEGYIKAQNEAILYGQKVSELFSDLSVTEKENEDDRLADLAEMNKSEIELAIAKNSVILDNEDNYFTDRIQSLYTDYALRKRLNELDRDEQLRLAKDSYEKQQTTNNNFKKQNIELEKSYLNQMDDLLKLQLRPITELLNTDFRKDLLKPVEESAKKAGKELEEVGKKAQRAEAALLKLQATTNTWLRSFSSDVFSNSGFKSLETYFDGTFKNLLKGAEGSKEKFAVYFNSIAESAQEAFNFITNASQQNFDGEKNRLEEQYNIALGYAGDNKAAQEKLAKDLEAQKKDIANREAKAKKQQAIFNIAMDTAQGIVSALASTPPNIVLSAIIAGIGAAQIAVVSSQKVPQYFKGGTHDGGMMMVNDAPGSNFRETVVTPDGNIHKPQGRNVLMNAPSGTKIYTPEQWDAMEQEKQIFNMLNPRGINMNYNHIPDGFNYEAMDGIMNKYLGNVTVEKTVIDKDGFSNYVERQGSKTKINRGFASSKGYRFK